MDVRKLSRGEGIAIVGGVLLAVGLFLSWYHAKTHLTTIGGHKGPITLTGWDVHTTLRYLLIVAAVAPIILTYIVIRGHALSWPRGELTAVVAIFSFGLIAYNAFLSKPGLPKEQVSLQYGVFVSILGTGAMLFGASRRTAESGATRKPPGVL